MLELVAKRQLRRDVCKAGGVQAGRCVPGKRATATQGMQLVINEVPVEMGKRQAGWAEQQGTTRTSCLQQPGAEHSLPVRGVSPCAIELSAAN
jgi:hypothetical protein